MSEVKALTRAAHVSALPEHKALRARLTGVELHTVMRAFELRDATPEMAEHVRSMRAVLSVTQQRVFRTTAKPGSWGQDRIDQATLPLDDDYSPALTGQGVDIYIIDTGIDTNHVDFVSAERNVTNVYNAFGPVTNDTDGHLHGTHCAGTAGSNTYGVANQANILGVKVLSDAGSGSDATISAGLDWSVAYANTTGRRSVFSMSLGGVCNDYLCKGDISNAAVNAAVRAGIPVAIAAGNDADDACYYSPASATMGITVASTEIDDDASSFTNYGSCVDIAGPGTDITSTCAFVQCGDETSNLTISGTSMATPHVAGVLAQFFEANPSGTTDEALETLQCSSSMNQIDYSGSDDDAVNYLLQVSPLTPQTCDLTAGGCNMNCSGNGTCDTSGAEAECICFPGLFGDACDLTQEPDPVCLNDPSNSIVVSMQDSWGDGWSRASMFISTENETVFSTTLDAGASGTDLFCPHNNTCYDVRVTLGFWPGEVWWEIEGLVGGCDDDVGAQLCIGDDTTDVWWDCPWTWVRLYYNASVLGDGSFFAMRPFGGSYETYGIPLPPESVPVGYRDFCLEEGLYQITVIDFIGSDLTLWTEDGQVFPPNLEQNLTVTADDSCRDPDDEVWLFLQDSWGDGWNGANLSVSLDGTTVFSTELPSGHNSTELWCVAQNNTCFDVDVALGDWPGEVWYEMGGLVAGAGFQTAQFCVGDTAQDYWWTCPAGSLWQDFNYNASGPDNSAHFQIIQNDGSNATLYGTPLTPEAFPMGGRNICLPLGSYFMDIDDGSSDLKLWSNGQLFVDGPLTAFTVNTPAPTPAPTDAPTISPQPTLSATPSPTASPTLTDDNNGGGDDDDDGDDGDDDGSGNLSDGEVAGIVIGSVFGFIIVLGLLFTVVRGGSASPAAGGHAGKRDTELRPSLATEGRLTTRGSNNAGQPI